MLKKQSFLHRLFLFVLLAAAILAALFLCRTDSQANLQYFSLGIRHGAEDRQSGIVYAAQASGWKITRNGSVEPGDKELVQRLFTYSATGSYEVSAFMAGYRLGFLSPLYWYEAAIVVFLITTILLTLRRSRSLKQTKL